MHLLRVTAAAIVLLAVAPSAAAQTVFDTTLGEANQKTAEVSTHELKEIIKSGSALLLDARPPMEYAVSHIPGALNVAPQSGRPAHLYISDVAEVGRLLGGAKERALVLYCNGPFCGKTKRLGTELLGAGYTNVRRYQLGAPSWRTLASEGMQTELAALPYIKRDQTAVWIDAREPAAFLERATLLKRPSSWQGPRRDEAGEGRWSVADGRPQHPDHRVRIKCEGCACGRGRDRKRGLS